MSGCLVARCPVVWLPVTISKLNMKKLVIGIIYRPPHSNVRQFTEKLTEMTKHNDQAQLGALSPW